MKLILGDCLEKMKDIPDESIDAVITDSPYGIGFMSKGWDRTGIANSVEMWSECLRVLKPGGHLLSFGGTRTYHRMACAIEDAGFEIRDMVEWCYGSGFPKSLSVGKAVDKLQGNEREIIGKKIVKGGENLNTLARENKNDDINAKGCGAYGKGAKQTNIEIEDTKGTSEWEGWGTALKPAHEPICMARKPLSEKTVAENVLEWGTGGLNIDASRVEYTGKTDPRTFGGKWKTDKAAQNVYEGGYEGTDQTVSAQGRFPANLIHDNSEEVRECFPEQKSGAMKKAYEYTNNGYSLGKPTGSTKQIHESNSGNASRFFKSIIYQAKASKSERNKGCEGLEEKDVLGYEIDSEHPYRSGKMNNSNIHQLTMAMTGKPPKPQKNNHPTVKPIALMEYLIKMVTPKGGTVLDPFMGSGTTGVACKNLNRDFIGIELDREYFEIAKKRIENYKPQLKIAKKRAQNHKQQFELF